MSRKNLERPNMAHVTNIQCTVCKQNKMAINNTSVCIDCECAKEASKKKPYFQKLVKRLLENLVRKIEAWLRKKDTDKKSPKYFQSSS